MKARKFAVIVSRFNEEVTTGLLNGAKSTLAEKGYGHHEVDVVFAPGAFEIPLIAQKLARTGRYLGVVCLGAVIKGETAHFEFISLGAATGIMQAMLATEVPIAFGVLTTYTEEQAVSRSRQDAHNKGREAALACLETAQILGSLRSE